MQHCRPRMPLELWVLTVLLIFVFIFIFYFNDIFNVRNTYKFFFLKKIHGLGHLMANHQTFMVMISLVTLNCVNLRIYILLFRVFCLLLLHLKRYKSI